MEDDKRKLLQEKLKSVQEEVRKKELRNRIKYQIDYLENNDRSYNINYDNAYLNWMQRHFSMRKRDGYHGIHDFQIDVHDEDENCKAVYFENHNQIQVVLEKELLNHYSLEDEIVICKNGGDPELIISIGTFLTDVDFFLGYFEIWFILKDKSLVIEYISDRESIRFISRLETKKEVN